MSQPTTPDTDRSEQNPQATPAPAGGQLPQVSLLQEYVKGDEPLIERVLHCPAKSDPNDLALILERHRDDY